MRETREVWRGRVEQWETSGLTAKEFCSQHGLRWTTLSWWKWRLSREGAVEATTIPPRVIELRTSARVDERFEIVLGDRCVRVPPSFDPEALLRLLSALGEAR